MMSKSGREPARSIGSGELSLPVSKRVSIKCRQVAAGREADEADARRIDAEFLGTAAHQPHGARGIGESVTLHRVVRILGLGKPVLQDEGRDAVGVHPLGDIPCLP